MIIRTKICDSCKRELGQEDKLFKVKAEYYNGGIFNFGTPEYDVCGKCVKEKLSLKI